MRRSSGCALLFGLTSALCGCDRFPRDNPLYGATEVVEDDDAGVFEPIVSARRPLIDDQVGLALQNNGNRRAEPGESLRLHIFVNWSDDQNHTIAYLNAQPAADDSCIASVTPPALTTQLLAQEAGATAVTTVGPFEVQLRSEPCTAEEASFDVEVEDLGRGQNYTLTAIFPVSALAGQMLLTDMTVVGEPQPGSSITLQPEFRNAGSAMLRDVSLQVPSSAICLSAEGGGEWLSVGDLQPGEARRLATDALTYVVDGDCVAGDTLELLLELEDASGQVFPLLWTQDLE